MVEHHVSNGKRVAQLLASELTGRETGTLDRVSVSDADPDAVPDEEGAVAYRIEADDSELATVSLYPEHAELTFSREPATVETRLDVADKSVAVTNGAVVKDAVDLIRETVEDASDARSKDSS